MTAPHHDARGGFRNPWGEEPKGFRGLLRWRWERLRAGRRHDDGLRLLRDAALAQPEPALPRAKRDELIVTWVGHSTLLLQMGAINVVTDPMWSARASPLQWIGPRRVVAPGISLDALPPLDLVLVSHNHYDHLDSRSVRLLSAAHPSAEWVVPLGLGRFVRARGVRQVSELDWWEEHRSAAAVVTAAPAQHFSARTPVDRNRTLWCAFAVRAGGWSIFFAGDTGLHPEFGRIAGRLGPFDGIALPIGAYEPRWFMRPVHMDPDEAVEAYLALGRTSVRDAVPVMIAMHWGTFVLTDEPVLDPPDRVRAAWHRAALPGDALWLLRHGETRRVMR